jgi:hypothetical protein
MTILTSPATDAVQRTDTAPNTETTKPKALVVFLENVGHISGVDLPQWTMNVIDYVTEEYAKLILRLFGAHRRYDRVIILEDDAATGLQLSQALLRTSPTHQVDLLLLVHGLEYCLVGCQGKEYVGRETFAPLLEKVAVDPAALDLRMVYGLNCYGASLAPTWQALGAQVANGATGVNWLPEPSLSVFLWHWLRGKPYTFAVQRSYTWATRVARRILPAQADGRDHPMILSSQQIISGQGDITL